MVKIWHSEDLNLIFGPIMAKIRGERDLNLILGCIVAKRRRRDRDSVASLRHHCGSGSLMGTLFMSEANRRLLPPAPLPRRGVWGEGNVSAPVSPTKKARHKRRAFWAERPRFELGIPFWSIHAFQACLLSHSSISPRLVPKLGLQI